MRSNRLATRLGLVALTALTALAFGACTPEGVPSAPAFAPGAARAEIAAIELQSQPVSTAPYTVNGVRRASALAADVTVQQVIGPRGGRLAIPAAGFALEVPAGAVLAPTTFRVTALAGDMLAYEFGPSGSTFAVPLVATQDLRVTNVGRLPKRASLRFGYFVSPTDVDGSTGTASVSQETVGIVAASGKSASFPVPHFSGWIIMYRDGSDAPDSTQVP